MFKFRSQTISNFYYLLNTQIHVGIDIFINHNVFTYDENILLKFVEIYNILNPYFLPVAAMMSLYVTDLRKVWKCSYLQNQKIKTY